MIWRIRVGKLLDPKYLLTASVLLGTVTLLVPWATIVAEPYIGGTCNPYPVGRNAEIGVHYWAPNPPAVVAGWGPDPAGQARYWRIQWIGRSSFAAMACIWLCFFWRARRGPNNLKDLALMVIALLSLTLGVVVVLLGPYVGLLPWCAQITVGRVGLATLGPSAAIGSILLGLSGLRGPANRRP